MTINTAINPMDAGLRRRPHDLFAQCVCKLKESANTNRPERSQTRQIQRDPSYRWPHLTEKPVPATPDSHIAVAKPP